MLTVQLGRVLVWVGCSAVTLGCNAILGLDAGEPRSSGGGGGAGGLSGGMGGGGSECAVEACPVPNTPCRVADCVEDACGEANAAERTACPAGLCTAEGACVECIQDNHCSESAPLCIQNECAAAHCNSNAVDGDETDVDCGGSCPGCNNGEDCIVGTDCESGYCPGSICTACAIGDCPSDQYCDEEICADDKSVGEACSGDAQCPNDACVNGYCCDSECAGSCEVCSQSLGATVNGSCTVAPAGANYCTAFVCDGVSTICPTICEDSSDCQGNHYCNCDLPGPCDMPDCLFRLTPGQSCVEDVQCFSGICEFTCQ